MRNGRGDGAARTARRASPAALALAAGCITVNLYLPVAEIREAAARIVSEARPAEAEARQPADGEPESRNTAASPARGWLDRLLAPRVAQAEERSERKIQLEIKTPLVQKIIETLKKRYSKLLPFYARGAVGEGRDGFLALRDLDGLGLKEKRDVQSLSAEENADRKSLYVELARANGIDASLVPDIGAIFAEEWQGKARTGWWIEVEKGKWERKAPKDRKDGR